MKICVVLTVLVCGLTLSWGTSDKIKIDPKTRLYVSREDGRVRVLHGLAIEAQGTPPYHLVTYTDEQIELFKTVSKMKFVLFLRSFIAVGSIPAVIAITPVAYLVCVFGSTM